MFSEIWTIEIRGESMIFLSYIYQTFLKALQLKYIFLIVLYKLR